MLMQSVPKSDNNSSFESFVFWHISVTPALLSFFLWLCFFQVAVYLKTVSAVTMGRGALGMTSSLLANTVLSVGLAGLVEIA